MRLPLLSTHIARSLIVIGAALLWTPAVYAQATCQITGSFNAFKQGVVEEALSVGVSPDLVRAVVPGLQFSNSVIAADRKQGVFAQSFFQFSGRMVAPYRVTGAQQRLRRYASTFDHVEAETGVPGEIISAFWALETDFGAVLGNFNTLNALATLAHDCRRPELFRPQLIAALQLLDRGDMPRSEFVGAWAGELGQLQILPSDILEHGVDENGDGRVDVRNTTVDVLATGGRFLQHLGWRRGEPWIQEVAVPDVLPWEKTGIHMTLPARDWASLGVTPRWGGDFSNSDLQASILLPMGRKGPAFMVYPNFGVFLEWNKSLVYTTSAAYLATRIAGAPRYTKGNPPDILSIDQSKALQVLLQERGFDVGKIDGIIGAGTRGATRAVQQQLGLPADAWPTRELLATLRAKRGQSLEPPPPPRPRPI